jgi:hypothetical protein
MLKCQTFKIDVSNRKLRKRDYSQSKKRRLAHPHSKNRLDELRRCTVGQPGPGKVTQWDDLSTVQTCARRSGISRRVVAVDRLRIKNWPDSLFAQMQERLAGCWTSNDKGKRKAILEVGLCTIVLSWAFSVMESIFSGVSQRLSWDRSANSGSVTGILSNSMKIFLHQTDFVKGCWFVLVQSQKNSLTAFLAGATILCCDIG